MEYTIAQNRLIEVVYKYLDETFEHGDMYWEWAEDYQDLIAGFTAKPSPDDDYATLFEYIKKEYYEGLLENNPEHELAKKWINKAPVLTFNEVDDSNFMSKLDTLFGNYWKPAFEKWFTDTYGDKFPVKTFYYHVR